jgi:hypothetical protein
MADQEYQKRRYYRIAVDHYCYLATISCWWLLLLQPKSDQGHSFVIRTIGLAQILPSFFVPSTNFKIILSYDFYELGSLLVEAVQSISPTASPPASFPMTTWPWIPFHPLRPRA